MTRINCVPVQELHTKHLVAEYRELPRIFGLVVKAIERGERPDDPRNPSRYVLGTGHVRFFYPRLTYCAQRFYDLVGEMKTRGYNPQHHYLPHWTVDIPEEWWSGWAPNEQSIAINRARIADRMPKH